MSMTTLEAAEFLGVSRRRVRTLIEEGKLPAQRFGKVYVLRSVDVRRYKRNQPGPGRPPSS